MFKANFELTVLVAGKPAREYVNANYADPFIEGLRSTDYELRISNRSNHRALAVIAVDGLSIIDGKLASSGGDGYVIGAQKTTTIPGWRLNNNEVAKFVFASQPEAYATQMKRGGNLGIIGAAFFLEHKRFAVTRGFGGVPESMGASKGATRGIGTGFGDRARHEVTEVDFDRDPSTLQTLIVRYDDREGLIRRGFRLDPDPSAFPADVGTGCMVPTGWAGR
ncbi:MAG: hypothetical protein AAB421_01185 [Patescibacteria group bacterium]